MSECKHNIEVNEELLWCSLEAGHDGEHFTQTEVSADVDYDNYFNNPKSYGISCVVTWPIRRNE